MINLTDIAAIRSLLSRHGFHFSKSLGQNFIVNPAICPRMAEESGASGRCVLEIGPGIGVLTAELAKRAQKVVSIELDHDLFPILNDTLKEFSNVEIVEGDVLKIDLAALLREKFGGRETVVCANLPYYITSPVLMRLLESRLSLIGVTVMVQKEAAKRICAVPGTREAGAISFAVHYYSKPKYLFSVSRGSFLPSPKVDSAVIRLDIHKEPPVRVNDEKMLFACIRAAFNQRRKTLRNALSAGLPYSRPEVEQALLEAGVQPGARGENLTLENFARLSDRICAINRSE